jgi:hypothetical protein
MQPDTKLLEMAHESSEVCSLWRLQAWMRAILLVALGELAVVVVTVVPSWAQALGLAMAMVVASLLLNQVPSQLPCLAYPMVKLSAMGAQCTARAPLKGHAAPERNHQIPNLAHQPSKDKCGHLCL